MSLERCAWVGIDPLSLDYHDKEWGIPLFDDQRLFEFLILEGMQAGLSWLTILKKRDNYRACFDNFNAKTIVEFNQQQQNELLQNPGIIRNRLKVQSIITNANAFLTIQAKYGSFSNYIWSFVEGKPIINHWQPTDILPSKTKLSDNMAVELKKNGFKFVGSTICYAFMQATGMVNDHTTNCFCYYSIANR